MQRFHTLLGVLTLSAACGSPNERQVAVTKPGVGRPVSADAQSPTPVAPVPPQPPVPPPPPPEPPKLACADGTSAVPAAFPDPTWFCTRADGVKDGAFFTLFPDLTVAIEGSYKAGKLDGPWKRHYPSGAVAEEGTYIAGQQDGVWIQYGRDGAKLGEYKLKAGTGKKKRWYDDGPIYSEIALKKGVPHGAMSVRDRDGRVVIKAKFIGGKLDDKHEVGFKNSLRIEETFSRGTRQGPRQIWQFWSLLIDEAYDNKGKLDGAFTIWRDKKVPRVQGTYEHGKRVGSWIWTDKQNKKEREGDYADGKKTGPWYEYAEGKMTFQGVFTDGKPDGEFIYYDKTGAELGRFTINAGTGTMLTFHSNKKPSSETKLVGGLMQGKYKELTTRGKVIVEGEYASDKKHGWWREWTDTGLHVSEIHYKRGKLDGAFKKYTGGKLAVSATYKDGKAEGTYTEYKGDKPYLTGQFTGDRRTGTWTIYNANGTPTLVANYKNGVLDGTWREIAGDTTTEGQLVAGRPSGTWNQTDRSGSRAIDHKTP